MSTTGKRDFRPVYHFTPEKMWMNDPNGMAYVNGKWHLFYQYYPEGTEWGPMHWGHAVSGDLLHWEHLPVALAPDALGMVFSGSAVTDGADTSGFAKGGCEPLVAVYTAHGEWEQQSLAVSLDGIHFEKYEGNPVIPNSTQQDFRDPKVFWDGERGRWGLVLAAGDHVEFYASPDLKEWKKTGEFVQPGDWCAGNVWECPDLFPLACGDGGGVEAAAGDGSGAKWVLLVSTNGPVGERGSCTWYWTGEFDGNHFVPDTAAGQAAGRWPRLLDYGYDNYAGVTWFGGAERVFLGWASNWRYAAGVPTGEYCGQMTFAGRLSLTKRADGGFKLCRTPVIDREKALDMQHMEFLSWEAADRHGEEKRLEGEVFHFHVSSAGVGSICFVNACGQELEVGIRPDGRLFVDRSRCLPLAPQAGVAEGEQAEMIRAAYGAFRLPEFGVAESEPLWGDEGAAPGDSGNGTPPEAARMVEIDIYWDRSVLEVYADGGSTTMTMLAFPDEPFHLYRIQNTEI